MKRWLCCLCVLLGLFGLACSDKGVEQQESSIEKSVSENSSDESNMTKEDAGEFKKDVVGADEGLPETIEDLQPKEEIRQDETQNLHSCEEGQQLPCYTSPKGCKLQSDGSFRCTGSCAAGVRTCEKGQWSSCKGQKGPKLEFKDGIDNDCDGKKDNVFVQITSGAGHSCGLLNDGMLKCWGDNTYGQLGRFSERQNHYIPALVMVSHEFSTSAFLQGVKKVSVAGKHTCALLDDKTVSCWGENWFKQLGNIQSWVSRSVGVSQKVKGLKNVKQITTGLRHTCILQEDGKVKCWGDNKQRQLGSQKYLRASEPLTVQGLNGVRDIVAGGFHTCALLMSGKVKCWGDNVYGQLGDSLTNSSVLRGVKQLALGLRHTCALFSDNTVGCWGKNKQGQLGIGSNIATTTLQKVKNLKDVKEIHANGNMTCALQKDGKVKCWGMDMYDPYDGGSPNDGYASKINSSVPFEVSEMRGVQYISVGAWFVCGLANNNMVKCWGKNRDGVLGKKAIGSLYPPTKVNDIEDSQQIVTGLFHTCSLLTNGQVKCWGTNTSFQLGSGPVERISKAKLVPNLGKVVKIVAGNNHTCALLMSGKVKCWGDKTDFYDTTGSGFYGLPTVVEGLEKVKDLAAGDNHTCALLSNSSVKCWGNNKYGQLGDDTQITSSAPVEVRNLSNVKQVAAGRRHTCALRTDGIVRCWGDNLYKQLGQKEQTVVKNAKQIAAGEHHTCALRTDGSVYCWGSNLSGELGGNTATFSSAPVRIKSNKKIKKVITGRNATCLLSESGELSCWGNNNLGQFGTGASEGYRKYHQAFRLSRFLSVSLGSNHACGILPDRKVSCWGSNSHGQVDFISK